MTTEIFEVESKTPFSESLIWQLNRAFYQTRGITAWSEDIVPHQLTSNSKVGYTYAELILAFLKDLAQKNSSQEVVYIVELGAGHGRLAFHVLKHLQKLVDATNLNLPKYCYVLSDIVEDNLSFFLNHPQFQHYYKQGLLDVSYFDAIEGNVLQLRYAKQSITANTLKQPIIAIANYFFDSIPNDLFFIKDTVISNCSISIDSSLDPNLTAAETLLKNLEFTYHNEQLSQPHYQDAILNEILNEYGNSLNNSYLFFPEKAIKCLNNLCALSAEGLLLLTMDKGFHEIHNLKNKKQPDIVTHGSFSLWVNYHALNSYCIKQGGLTFFPAFSNFSVEVACLLFLPKGQSYLQTNAAYQQFVNNFGPDDFNNIKKIAYNNLSRLTLKELLAIFRLSAYDSTIFIKLLPRLKQLHQSITQNEHIRLIQTMQAVWNMYFHIDESLDLAYELGGLFYDLGHFGKALNHFQYSEDLYGIKADIYYNRALCYYQLREDQLFFATWKEGKTVFPEFKLFDNLKQLEID